MGCNKTKIIIGPKERGNKPTNSYILYHFIKTRNLQAKFPKKKTKNLNL